MQLHYLFFTVILALCLLALPTPSFAGHGEHAVMPGTAKGKADPECCKDQSTNVYSTKGKIVSVEQGRINMYHEPVPALQWPAMTMPFSIEDASLLKGLKPGDPVRFDFRPTSPSPTIVDIEVVK
ncbi:MAG: copper-binding protein [Desulfovibrio sp.]|jgi:Cu/Ag efflux protein CusF|nr:copper-binding protein [Desulfovibrio sp.]